MKGYIYLDMDGELCYRTWEYINETDPMFFATNKSFIVKSWYFDTDNKIIFNNMIQSFADLKVPEATVRKILLTLGLIQKVGVINAGQI